MNTISQAKLDLEKYNEIMNKDENKLKINEKQDGLDAIDQEFSKLKYIFIFS